MEKKNLKVKKPIDKMIEDMKADSNSSKDILPPTTLLVYLGVFKESERIGKSTGIYYLFTKDEYGMPKPLAVYNKDKKALLDERGQGCARRKPEVMFMTLDEWEKELAEQRKINS